MKLTHGRDVQSAIRVTTMIQWRRLMTRKVSPRDSQKTIYAGEDRTEGRIDPSRITRVHVSTTDGVGGKLKLHYANLTVI